MRTANPFRVNLDTVPPEGLQLSGEVTFSLLEVEDDDRVKCPEPLAFSLQITIVQSSYLVQGELRTVLRCRCDRCLCECERPVSTTDVCHLIEEGGDPIVDLTPDIREDILLTFPHACLCKPDCLGLCARCGEDLNRAECTCPPETNDRGAWSALDALHLPTDAEGD